jgi:hypothetical protein
MVNEVMTPIWFPEPSTVDDSWGRRGEQPVEWLARSTLTRARAMRRFLNENISKIPVDTQSKIFDALHHRYKSAFFELIVARTLQILGATITVEAKQSDNKQPDFLAQFPDSLIVVEAASPNFNADAGEEVKNRNPLTDIIESLVPEGWSVQVWELPKIGQADSKKAFKRVVAEMLSIPPPSNDASEIDLTEELPSGIIDLHLVPRRPNWPPIALESPSAVIDDSKELIRRVVRRKRRQVRKADVPVLLAIEGSWLSGSLESFDLALYGHTCAVFNVRREMEAPRFIADGLFTNISDKTPTYAGVLAFPEVGFSSVSMPVLYHHPRFDGHLPKAFSVLEQHWYEHGMGINSVKIRAKTSENLLEPLVFVRE